MVLSLRRSGVAISFAIALITITCAPCFAFVAPSRAFSAALAFDAYAPAADDLSGFRLDTFNWLLPQTLGPSNDPFCTSAAGCRNTPFTFQYSATLEGFTQLFHNTALSQWYTPLASHVDRQGAYHFGMMMGIPIPTGAASVVSSIRLGRASWARSASADSPTAPMVSVEAGALPASADPDSLSYALVFVASSFTSPTQEDISAWYLLPYVGPDEPHIVLRNYGTQPIFIVATGMITGVSDPTALPCRTDPFCSENSAALGTLNATDFPAPGLSGSTFSSLDPQPPQTLAPSSSANPID